MTNTNGIARLEREQYEAKVQTGTLTVFRYTPNSRGFVFLLICAALLFFIAYVVYLITHFEPTYWIVLSGALSATGIGLVSLRGYWTTFARKAAVAFDDDFLYIVSMRKIHRVSWNHLSIENAGFHDEKNDGNHGTLRIRIHDDQVFLRLFNPFVWVEDFPTFLVELLSQIKRNTKPGSEGEATAQEAE